MRSQAEFPEPCKKHFPWKNVGDLCRAIPQRVPSPSRNQSDRTGVGERTVTTNEDELQQDERWKEVTLHLLSTVLEQDSIRGLVDPRHVLGAYIRHNAHHVGKHGIVTLEDKTGDLPQWLLSALRSLSHWRGTDGLYEGFERDVFRSVIDYFQKLPEPLLTYRLYSVFSKILVLSGYLVLSKYASPPRPLAPSHRRDPWRPMPQQQHPHRFSSCESLAPNALHGNGFEHELYQNGEMLRQRPSRHFYLTDVGRKCYKRERSCSAVSAGDVLLEVGAGLNSMANVKRGRSQSLPSTREVAVSPEKGHPFVICPGHSKRSNCFSQENIDPKPSSCSHIHCAGPIPRARSLSCIVQTSLLTTFAETSSEVNCKSGTFRPQSLSARSQILPTLYGPNGITMVLVKHPTCEATALLAMQLLCLLLPPWQRRCLQLLLRTAARLCSNVDLPPLQPGLGTRTLVVESLSPALLRSPNGGEGDETLNHALISFMLDHAEEVTRVPAELLVQLAQHHKTHSSLQLQKQERDGKGKQHSRALHSAESRRKALPHIKPPLLKYLSHHLRQLPGLR
uniref:DEP domain-containing protein n=1 Tax=Eptatretus burgeri TaxID=7764 RepID=A0A8C4QPK2_EPTBU